MKQLFSCLFFLLLAFGSKAQVSQFDTTFIACSTISQQIGVNNTPGFTYSWAPTTNLSNPTSSNSFFTLSNTTQNPFVNVNYVLSIRDQNNVLVQQRNYHIYVVGMSTFSYSIGDTVMCDHDTARVPLPPGVPLWFDMQPPDYYSFNPIDSSLKFWPSASTTYQFVITDTAGCARTNMFYTLNLLPRIPVTLSTPDSIFCITQDESIQLNYTPPGGIFLGAGISQTGVYNVVSSGVGPHTITYVYNFEQCPSTASVHMEVISENYITLNAIPNFCQNDTLIELTFATPPGGQYSIDGQPISIYNPSTLSAGQHTMTYLYALEAACTFEKSIPFFIIPLPPQPSIEAFPSASMCATDTITLTSSPFTHYLWSTGDTTRSIRTNASGPYTVTAISNNGCFISSDTINVYLSLPFEMSLQSHPFPNGFDLSAFESNDGHVSVLLDGAASPYEVEWEGVHSSQIEYENLAATTYHVSVTDAAGCFASDSITLTQPAFVPPLPVDSTLQYPNGFTPNGDGYNDYYRILGVTQKYRVNTFRVWDISRALVYTAENYSSNWDGRDTKGNKLPAGTYYAVFESPELAEPASFFIDLRYE